MQSALPTLAEWRAVAPALGLKRKGRELVGPCPVCGGTDRFRITAKGGAFCRQCAPDGSNPAALRRIVEAAGFAWPERPNAAPARAHRAQQRPSRPQDTRKGRIGDSRRSEGDSRGPGGQPSGPSDARAPRIALAQRIWAAARPDPGPVGAYLASRGAWPPGLPLPPCVRWLAREELAAFHLRGFPDAAGAACYSFEADGEVRAAQLEPMTGDGERRRWRNAGSRKTYGAIRGAAMRVGESFADFRPDRPPSWIRPTPIGANAGDTAGNPMSALHVAEGPVDALAICTWRRREAWAGGGASLFPALAPALAATGRPITIEPDGDGPGRRAAAKLAVALRRLHIAPRLIPWPPGVDPADGLASAWHERAAILEADTGTGRREAEAVAWNEMRPPWDGGR